MYRALYLRHLQQSPAHDITNRCHLQKECQLTNALHAIYEDTDAQYLSRIEKLNGNTKATMSMRFDVAVDWIEDTLRQRIPYLELFEHAEGAKATRDILISLCKNSGKSVGTDPRTDLQKRDIKLIQAAVSLMENSPEIEHYLQKAVFEVTAYAEVLLDAVQIDAKHASPKEKAVGKVEHHNITFGAHLAQHLDIDVHPRVSQYLSAIDTGEITPLKGRAQHSSEREMLMLACLEVGNKCGLKATHNEATDNAMSSCAAIFEARSRLLNDPVLKSKLNKGWGKRTIDGIASKYLPKGN